MADTQSPNAEKKGKVECTIYSKSNLFFLSLSLSLSLSRSPLSESSFFLSLPSLLSSSFSSVTSSFIRLPDSSFRLLFLSLSFSRSSLLRELREPEMINSCYAYTNTMIMGKKYLIAEKWRSESLRLLNRSLSQKKNLMIH